MAMSDPRGQLLANLKYLYGADVEVVIVSEKFLHGTSDCTSTRDAIETLLQESEMELSKLLLTNGNKIPFQTIMVQTLTLHGEEQRNFNARSSVRSKCVYTATPRSTLSDDNVPDTYVSQEQPVENATFKQLLVHETPEEPLDEESIPISEVPEPLFREDKRKEKAKLTFDETQLGEQYLKQAPADELPAEPTWTEEETLLPPTVEPEPEPVADDFGWTPRPSVVEPEPEPALESLADDFGWGSHSTSKKKKKGKAVTEETPRPSIVEPAPEPVADDLSWGFFSTSKKKKKGKAVIEETPLPSIVEPEPAPEPLAEWGPFSTSEKTKKSKNVIEETPLPSIVEPEPASEPVADDFGWGSISTAKKKKKGKTMIEEKDRPLPEAELKLEDPRITPPTTPSESQPIVEDSVWETLRPEAPLSPESVGNSTSALSLITATNTEITTNNIQAQMARSGGTVVFTIQFPNEISHKPLQVMATIADNTRIAIIDTVNSHLDSHSMLKGIPDQRKLEIKYGVSRNGFVNLSALEEAMWPETLDYFRQYTKILELTIDVMDY